MHSNILYARIDHLDYVYKIWGLNRATLGLMPRDAFKECIAKKWILIAEISDQVVGYLQFRFTARNQTLSIVHLCIDISSRGNGLAEQLLDRLVEDFKFKARGIKLSCRSDYSQAISFWTRYNFQPKGKLPSRGNNPNVYLIIWWYSFGQEDLFSIQKNDKVKAVLDFNIIAKLMEMPVSDEIRDEIIQLQSDWLVTEVEYYQTSETTSEIFRDADPIRVIGDTLIIYTTQPQKAITAIAIVKSIIKCEPQEMWQRHNEKLGIDKAGFDNYYKNHKVAVGIELSQVIPLDGEILLSAIKLLHPAFTPPQTFKYLNKFTTLRDFKYLLA